MVAQQDIGNMNTSESELEESEILFIQSSLRMTRENAIKFLISEANAAKEHEFHRTTYKTYLESLPIDTARD